VVLPEAAELTEIIWPAHNGPTFRFVVDEKGFPLPERLPGAHILSSIRPQSGGIVVPAAQWASTWSAHQRNARYEPDDRLVPLHGCTATRTYSGEMQSGLVASSRSGILSFNHPAAISTIG